VPDVADSGPLRALLRALARYPSLFSLGPDAVGLYGLDGSVVASNAAAGLLIHESFSNFHTGRHLNPGELEHAEAKFESALAGEAVEFDAVVKGHNGEEIDVVVRLVPAYSDGTIVGVFASGRDVTLRLRAEASRDESRQQFRSLFEQHPDSISKIDAAGRFVRLNAAAERIMGYLSEEVAGRMVGDVYPPGSDREALDALVRAFILAGKPTRYHRIVPRKDGTPTVLEGTAVPIVVNGKVTGIFLLSHDITARERLHEALALAARRMTSLYRLASDIGASPVDQAKGVSAFSRKELGFETSFVVEVAGEALSLVSLGGAALSVDTTDPLFGELLRETAAGSALLELDTAALEERAAHSGAGRAFCRSFLGVPLRVEGGRTGALGFTSWSVPAPLTDFDREFVRAVAEFIEASIARTLVTTHLQGLANFDALTALPNRLLLEDRFTQAIVAAKRRGERVAVYYIDVDKFKGVNDAYGHHAGDEVLRTVARRLLEACRASDTVARLGGDEFIVLRSGPGNGTPPEALAARLHAAFAAPCEIEGLRLKISIGIGISVYPQDGADQVTLLQRADTALYAAKARGAGSIRRFGALPPAAGVLAESLGARFRNAVAERTGAALP
jgi:diguanylate cyclase (GGDEF)-like protein/PAS domain S-box-containing protein